LTILTARAAIFMGIANQISTYSCSKINTHRKKKKDYKKKKEEEGL
jgi:hypothetical protein